MSPILDLMMMAVEIKLIPLSQCPYIWGNCDLVISAIGVCFLLFAFCSDFCYVLKCVSKSCFEKSVFLFFFQFYTFLKSKCNYVFIRQDLIN